MFRALLNGLSVAFRKRPHVRRPSPSCRLRLEQLEEREMLSATAVDGNHGYTYAPIFSPDGSHLAFLTYDSGTGYRAYEDGVAVGGNHQYVYVPSFSPAGDHLSFVTYDSGTGYRVYEDGRAVGGNHGYISSLTFSPDGQHLAF